MFRVNKTPSQKPTIFYNLDQESIKNAQSEFAKTSNLVLWLKSNSIRVMFQKEKYCLPRIHWKFLEY